MKKILILLLLTVFLSPAFSKDYVSKLLGNTVATFTDAAEMLYNSFNPVELARNKKRQEGYRQKLEELRKKEKTDLKEMREFLKQKGIDAVLLSQPVAKQDIAKLLFQRFKKLPQSFLTKSLEFNYLYFRDAQDLGIFEKSEFAEETITTKSMLNSFLKASKISSGLLQSRHK